VQKKGTEGLNFNPSVPFSVCLKIALLMLALQAPVVPVLQ
jgi:hypothetical protein